MPELLGSRREKFMPLIADALPITERLVSIHRRSAEPRARLEHGRREPASRMRKRRSHHALACSGTGCPRQRAMASRARGSCHSYCSVALSAGAASTLTDTSQMTPSTPQEPAIKRETS